MKLGYDPRPHLRCWRGTPIPPVEEPLARSAARWRIAGRVWWHGPPWTVLRNADRYIWAVMDHGSVGDVRFTLADIPDALWRRALAHARPGLLSKGSYVLWSLLFDAIDPGDPVGWWPDTAHLRDCRPMADQSRERLYARHAHRRVASPGSPAVGPITHHSLAAR